jgi:hypothetical protein
MATAIEFVGPTLDAVIDPFAEMGPEPAAGI